MTLQKEREQTGEPRWQAGDQVVAWIPAARGRVRQVVRTQVKAVYKTGNFVLESETLQRRQFRPHGREAAGPFWQVAHLDDPEAQRVLKQLDTQVAQGRLRAALEELGEQTVRMSREEANALLRRLLTARQQELAS